MGRAYRKLGNNAAAIACCEQALAIDPHLVEAQVRACTWQLPPIHARPEDIEPARRNYHTALLRLDALLAALSPAELAEAVRGPLVATIPLNIAYQGYAVRELQELYGGMVSRAMAAVYPQWAQRPEAAPPRPGEPIRVGLVSPNFRSNPHWRMLLKGWLTRLDRRRFAVSCYALGGTGDGIGDFMRPYCSRLVEGDYSLEEWCRAIAGDGLHVLIYAEMGTDGMSERLAALRLAPVQCVAWANPLTSGLPTIDYFLSSELGEPPNAAAHYSESLIRLPNLCSYLEPVEWTAARGDRAAYGLREGATVYLCNQWLLKYLPQYDEIYPRIAVAVPDCQFAFNNRHTRPATVRVFEQRMERAFAAYGLDWKQHIVIGPPLEPSRFHRQCQLCDVFLDSLGYSGATTTMEAALAHDLPIVTHAAEFMRGRQTLAILRRMGVTETIAASVDEYVDLAVRLGRDASARAQAAARIAANKHKVYHDGAAIAGLENFLERVVTESSIYA